MAQNSKLTHDELDEFAVATDDERLEKLFSQIDVNSDGRVDVSDLSTALDALKLPHNRTDAQKFIEQSDFNKSGDITLSEFVQYIKSHEKKLRLVFVNLDKNKDGRLDVGEIVAAFQKLGIDMDNNEAQRLMQRMDKDGSLAITYDEWRDFLLFHPSADLSEIIRFWRHSTYLDIGEDINIPDDFTAEEMVTGMWWRHLVAGGLAGAVSRTCTAPLDRLKVFLQVHGLGKFSSIGGCLRHMLKEGGVWSLWRGNGINVMKIAPESALKFMAYEQAKRIVRGRSDRDISIYERFACGSLAGGVSQTVIYPMEVLKTRLALRETGQYRGIADAAKQIYLMEGVKSFYRGYIPNLLGIIPYAGIDLAIYETLKKNYLQRSGSSNEPPVIVLLACGTVSSTCGQISSYPLALVRTRLQAQAVLTSSGTTAPSMVSLFRNIIQTEGVVGLYRGITPNFLKVAPAVSISYVVYERCRNALGVKMT